jgi:hypothetical protein
MLPGGMIRLANGIAVGLEAARTPSCDRITYRGNAGYISVQERNHGLQWGITMTPFKYSVGSWHVSTYLNGKKTSSGFNRTVKHAYKPHGDLQVRAGKTFHVQAKVVNKYGTFVNVPNACHT